MKIKGTIITFVMVWLLISCQTSSSSTREATVGENIFYYLDRRSGGIIISGGILRTSDLVIPERIRGREVTFIAGYAFRNKQLTSVSLPSTLRGIGPNAFSNNQITSVTIPNSVRDIHENSFINNPLTSVIIPNSAESIGAGAFSNNQLTSVTIPDGVTDIGANTFRDNRLTSVIIPASVQRIGAGAFMGNQLTSVTIPDGFTEIEADTFRDNHLNSVIIPYGVTLIHRDAFRNNQLTNVNIPRNVRAIDSGAFADNPLSSITINQNPSEHSIGLINDVSVVVPSNTIYVVATSLGDLTWAYAANNKRPGTYSMQGNEVLYNGTELPRPAVITTGPNAWLVSINGQQPALYIFDPESSSWQSRTSIQRRTVGNFPYPRWETDKFWYYASSNTGLIFWHSKVTIFFFCSLSGLTYIYINL